MSEPVVSVAILKEHKIEFELYGEFSIEESGAEYSGKYTALYENGKIAISNGETTKVFDKDITFTPDDFENESFLIRDVIIGIQFHWQQKEKQRFLGSLKILIEDDMLCAVNILPVEDYLTSVISSEMNANSSVEFLKAHAIISRSWLLAQIDKHKKIEADAVGYSSKIENDEERIRWYDREDHTLYDVCADDHCQRYQGITKLYAHNAQTAVSETRGLIVGYEGKICDARFSKSCGGIAESFENVWEPVHHPYLTKVIDYKFDPDGFNLNLKDEKAADTWLRNDPPAFCNTHDEKILSQVLQDYDRETTDFYRWTVELTQEQVTELIARKSGIDFGQIVDLIPVERGDSGRLIKLKVVGTKKTLTIGKELEIRRILSESHLYSSAFVVDKFYDDGELPVKFVLTGGGWGHGVGLCQIGAAVMCEKGYSFDEILLHYFRGAEIKKIY